MPCKIIAYSPSGLHNKYFYTPIIITAIAPKIIIYKAVLTGKHYSYKFLSNKKSVDNILINFRLHYS